ncbi:MAG TPA: 23S rRNA (uracil(1939)-C(5))-methyltransferase RlmD [Woeseiaceae bacterium]|nr:23S rRNA (uracil(1939)-C(5))-methyltransferase RlmD [Woeseiaceae bacterium]
MARKQREPEEARILGITHEGRGIAEVPGKKVFVDGALAGERVRFVRVRRRKNYDEARLEAVLEASPHRVEPGCAVYGLCGGCSLQHLAAERQIEAKQQVLLDNLERIGCVVPGQVLEPLRGPAWHYRRRARLGVRYVRGKGRVLVGFRERFKPYVTDTGRCEVLAEPVGGLLGELAELIAGLSVRELIPQIEVAVGDDLTALVLRVLQVPSAEDEARLLDFAAAHGLWFFLQTGGAETVEPLPAADASLPEPLCYGLPEFDLAIRFRPLDFIQVNGVLNRALVSRAVDLLGPAPHERVLDLFCGIGNFTLPLARRSGEVLGIEGSADLVRRAEGNAAANGLGNVTFLQRDLAEPDASERWLRADWDRVLLDPARPGADVLARHFAARPPRRLVYVSCHPGTLARDAGTLTATGRLRLSAAGVLDMFPHTSHMESIAVFDKV